MDHVAELERRIRAALNRLNTWNATWEGDPAPPENDSKDLEADAQEALSDLSRIARGWE